MARTRPLELFPTPEFEDEVIWPLAGLLATLSLGPVHIQVYGDDIQIETEVAYPLREEEDAALVAAVREALFRRLTAAYVIAYHAGPEIRWEV